MGKYIFAFLIAALSSASFADEQTEIIKTDLKFLCQINKIEKKLIADKSLSTADTIERIAAMKAAATRAQETKDAIGAISTVDKKEQAKLWKKFAKDNKVKMDCP